MNLPEPFVRRTQELLGDEFPDFLDALDIPSPVSVRVNDKTAYVPSDDRVKWCDSGYYLSGRPVFTLDPLFHAGVYYVQEASSMFSMGTTAASLPESLMDLTKGRAPLTGRILPSNESSPINPIGPVSL